MRREIAIVMLMSLLFGCDVEELPMPPVGEAQAILNEQTQMIQSVVSSSAQHTEVRLNPNENKVFAVYRRIHMDDIATSDKVSNTLPTATDSYTVILPESEADLYPDVFGDLNVDNLSPGTHNVSLLAYALDPATNNWDLSKYYVFSQDFTIQACTEFSCADWASLWMVAQDVPVYTDSEFEVSVVMKNLEKVVGVEFDLDYDKTRLKFLNHTEGTDFGNFNTFCDNNSDHLFCVIMDPVPGVSGEAELMRVRFFAMEHGNASIGMLNAEILANVQTQADGTVTGEYPSFTAHGTYVDVRQKPET